MALPVPIIQLQPGPEARRLRLATALSVGVHALVLLLIGLLAAGPEAAVRVFEPIEVTLAQAQPPPVQKLEVIAQPTARAKPVSALPGGGSVKGRATRNPSPITPVKPQVLKPASNAGGKQRAAFAPPHLLTSKSGRSPSGPVGQGSASSGPGGREEVPGEGPSYGPGVGGGADPIYPKGALDQGLEGAVTVTVTVGSKGEVQEVTVTSSSGHPLLDQAAVRAVKRWTFTPGMAKGKPAVGKVAVTFRFQGREVTRG